MLVDNLILTVKAGNGGNGAATFLRNAQTAKGGPDGGNGGNGGSIFFQGSTNVTDLKQFRYQKKIFAPNGIHGQHNKMHGKNADDLLILVPVGTQITVIKTAEHIEISDTTPMHLVVKGGKGGRGNVEFKSAQNQKPTFAEKGELGEEKVLRVELKLIADVGLIGLPNAGKSSLLAVLTHATPKIGDYPFTTLEPNVGMLGKYMLADIPGLIEGASGGRGLGAQFLKHIEKTKVLVHCIELTQAHPQEAYDVIRKEFQKYNIELTKKPEIILFTKADLVDKKKEREKTMNFKKKHHLELTNS